MKKIREKLCSENGASILLALLFFLLCAMVGASVLMAAASNAGKSRGNREEQQKYLTLSSALQLVCDELTAAEYTAKYEVKTDYKVDTWSEADEGEKQTPLVWHYEHTYSPIAGAFDCGLSKEPNNVLPLLDDLDKIFADSFLEKNDVDSGTHRHYYNKPVGALTVQPRTLTLSVTPDDGTWLTKGIEIVVKLNKDYSINLTAKLAGNDDYTMFAALSLDGGRPQLKESNAIEEGPVIESCAVRWKLSQITREETRQ